jgi:glutamate carboxypeptidase
MRRRLSRKRAACSRRPPASVQADAVVSLLRRLVEIESPTGSSGVIEVAEVMADELRRRGAQATLLAGGHLRADLPGAGAPLVVVGHCDTVWPEGTLVTMPFTTEGDVARGPGAYDMKACLVLLLAAIDEAGPVRRPLRVFLTADEEQGSRTAREPLQEAVEGVAAAFVVEPPTPSGHLKTSRKGLGRFSIAVDGRPAHAGTNLADGASAVEELAHQIIRLHALTDHERGISVNVGTIAGGTAENVVAGHAEAKLDVRVARAADVAAVEETLRGLEPVIAGTQITVSGDWTRPPLEPTPASRTLFAKAQEHAAELGLELGEAASGGGSDANLIAAHGVPVLDGLGAQGGGAHGYDEHVRLDTLPLRARVLARLLEDPGL